MSLREIDWAQWYDRTATSVSHLERAYSPSRFLDALGRFLPRGDVARVLELGCAPGRWLAWAALRLGIRPVGVDLDAMGVRLSRSLYSRVPVVRANAFQLPFPDGAFSAVYSIGLIEHFDDPGQILREARRVLRPGGISLWLVPNLVRGSVARWHWRTFHRANFEAHRPFTLAELSDLVTRHGFELVHEEYSGLYLPHLQRVLGRLPVRSWLRRLERPKLCANLVVVGRRDDEDANS